MRRVIGIFFMKGRNPLFYGEGPFARRQCTYDTLMDQCSPHRGNGGEGEDMTVSSALTSMPRFSTQRSIVLVGLMGAGKSCVGRRLAARLNMPFADSDSEIEAAAGTAITDFFQNHGEAAFREGERKVIARLITGKPCVLATGGGAFCDPATRDLVAAHATSVWLRADLDLLVRRTAGKDHRPLLNQGNPREILARLIAARYPIYAEADVIVDTTDEVPEMTVEKILVQLSKGVKGLCPLTL